MGTPILKTPIWAHEDPIAWRQDFSKVEPELDDEKCEPKEAVTLALQIPRSRSYVSTLGPQVNIICILGVLG